MVLFSLSGLEMCRRSVRHLKTFDGKLDSPHHTVFLRYGGHETATDGPTTCYLSSSVNHRKQISTCRQETRGNSFHQKEKHNFNCSRVVLLIGCGFGRFVLILIFQYVILIFCPNAISNVDIMSTWVKTRGEEQVEESGDSAFKTREGQHT